MSMATTLPSYKPLVLPSWPLPLPLAPDLSLSLSSSLLAPSTSMVVSRNLTVLTSSGSTSISLDKSPTWAIIEESAVGQVMVEAGVVGVVTALAPPDLTHVLVERLVGLLHHSRVESLSLSMRS